MRMKSRDRHHFTAQLSAILNAGVPLSQALSMIESEMKWPWLILLIQKIHQGDSFALALKQSNQGFDAYYCGMIEIGEKTGQLSKIIHEIFIYLESADRLREKIRKALIYPCTVIAISISIIIGMLTWVIPTFENVFNNFNTQLPLPTLIVINSSNFLKSNLILIALICVVFLMLWALSWNFFISAQKLFDSTCLKMPIFGGLLQSNLIAKWALAINSLQQSGIPLLDAIRISARGSNHWSMHDFSVLMYQHLLQWHSIYTSALNANHHYPIFDRLTLQFIRVGESAGTFRTMLSFLAQHHEKNVDKKINIFLELLEPLLITFLGIVIGGMVIALYLPLFQLGQLT